LKRAALVLAAAVLLAVIFHAAILTAAAKYLVSSGPPHKADIAVVLGGDWSGNRVLKAAELVREGYAPKILVSGPFGVYGHSECDLEIPFAVQHGFPESYFVHLEHHAHSTMEEAGVIVSALRREHVTSVLLVTSDYHTRRAGRIFRHAAPDLSFYVVAAPDEYFSMNGWWRNREGRKTFLIEWMKTVAEWFGL
jgi:uncharacterized SAM-binding protein YcdF (DUF218 family)